MTAYNLLVTIINSPLLAFFFYSLIRFWSFRISKRKTSFLTATIDFAMIRLVLVCSVVTLAWTFLPFFVSLFGNDRYDQLNRAFGPYWFAFWWYPSILIITQLLWKKKFRHSEGFRLTVSVLLIIQPYLIERIVILGLRRDYIAIDWLANGYVLLILHFLIAFFVASLELLIWLLAQRVPIKKISKD